MNENELREWIARYADNLERFAKDTYMVNPKDKFSMGIGDGYMTVAVDLRMVLEK